MAKAVVRAWQVRKPRNRATIAQRGTKRVNQSRGSGEQLGSM